MTRDLLMILMAWWGLFAGGTCLADVLDEVTHQQQGTTKRFSTGLFDPESNTDAYHLAPGERRTFAELEGPGEIRHIWFTVAGDRRYPRSLVLRIYWDGAEVPSVETPIGDFFAAGNGMKANVSTLPIEVTSYGRALNSYWHMPFRKKARVELENQSPRRLCVYCQIDWLQRPSLREDTLYFHARYHQEFPVKPFTPYTIFEGQGEGQYVGQVLSTQNSLGSWYGEADDRYYIDGEETPSLVGTGTEDFFTDAWNRRPGKKRSTISCTALIFSPPWRSGIRRASPGRSARCRPSRSVSIRRFGSKSRTSPTGFAAPRGFGPRSVPTAPASRKKCSSWKTRGLARGWRSP
jgi:hypothetical protein